uniref:uncharacterized protein C22orf15 homolog isoform X2 n=1 Tax=Panthera onca TaxID=9690 RepID=UPI0029544053|nr:uncharacterized protein C22orf15 homolog isoform X2 [Panthera onca]
MFITVMFGAGCWELVNTWCSLVILTAHLRQRGQVPPDAAIALLAEDGHLVSLDEGASQAPSMGSPLLQERGTYVLVQIISKWGPRFPLGVMLGCERGTAVQDHPRPGPAPHFGQDLALTLPIQCLVDPSQGQQIGRVRGEGGNHQASQESVLLPPQRGMMGPPPAMSPYWRTWMTSVQSWQRSFAACQAYNPQVMAGGGARALGVTTRSKAPFQSHEGRAPCHPGPVSWGQEPAVPVTWHITAKWLSWTQIQGGWP